MMMSNWSAEAILHVPTQDVGLVWSKLKYFYIKLIKKKKKVAHRRENH